MLQASFVAELGLLLPGILAGDATPAMNVEIELENRTEGMAAWITLWAEMFGRWGTP